jgi:hypothetical protein
MAVEVLGNISQNKYQYRPLSREEFPLGTPQSSPIALTHFYEGKEKKTNTTLILRQ